MKSATTQLILDPINCLAVLATPRTINGVKTIHFKTNKLVYRKSCELTDLETKYGADWIVTPNGTRFGQEFLQKATKISETLGHGKNFEVWECIEDGKVKSQGKFLEERPVLLCTDYSAYWIAPRVSDEGMKR